jgi:acetylornithine deacetylase/succinyl-diaminopimelate desuccinylase-like protein
VVAQLRAFADSLQSPARFDFSVEPPFYPPFEIDGSQHPLTQAFAAASQAVLGAAVPFGYTVGVSDANLICGEAGIPCIFYGPLAGDFHQCTEWVDLGSLVPCAEVLLATALAVLREPR